MDKICLRAFVTGINELREHDGHVPVVDVMQFIEKRILRTLSPVAFSRQLSLAIKNKQILNVVKIRTSRSSYYRVLRGKEAVAVLSQIDEEEEETERRFSRFIIEPTETLDCPFEESTTSGRGVYFVKAVGADLVKIGYTISYGRRMKGLLTGCPFPLRVLALIHGPKKLERETHLKYRRFKLHGEWYHLSRELLEDLHALPVECKTSYLLGLKYPNSTCSIDGIRMMSLEQAATNYDNATKFFPIDSPAPHG